MPVFALVCTGWVVPFAACLRPQLERTTQMTPQVSIPPRWPALHFAPAWVKMSAARPGEPDDTDLDLDDPDDFIPEDEIETDVPIEIPDEDYPEFDLPPITPPIP